MLFLLRLFSLFFIAIIFRCKLHYTCTSLLMLQIITETGHSFPMRKQGQPVRLAFFFTVYSEAAFVKRLFSRLYSPSHYYLFHIDAVKIVLPCDILIVTLIGLFGLVTT